MKKHEHVSWFLKNAILHAKVSSWDKKGPMFLHDIHLATPTFIWRSWKISRPMFWRIKTEMIMKSILWQNYKVMRNQYLPRRHFPIFFKTSSGVKWWHYNYISILLLLDIGKSHYCTTWWCLRLIKKNATIKNYHKYVQIQPK